MYWRGGLTAGLLEADRRVHRKQCHTVKVHLQAAEGQAWLRWPVHHSEGLRPGATAGRGDMFAPLSRGPGHAQCDFGEAVAVARILGGDRRQRTRAFTELQFHYLFED